MVKLLFWVRVRVRLRVSFRDLAPVFAIAPFKIQVSLVRVRVRQNNPNPNDNHTLHYITLHKIVFRVPKITRTARTLYEIKGVTWEYSYKRKHLEKNKFLNGYRKQAEFVRI